MGQTKKRQYDHYTLALKLQAVKLVNHPDMRGQFRLYPSGVEGVSKGCIVVDQSNDFQILSSILSGGEQYRIPDTDITACGKVLVK